MSRFCLTVTNSKSWQLSKELRGDDLEFRIELIPDHVLDRHECPAQRAWAASAGAFVSDPESISRQLDDLQPAAVAGEIWSNPFIQKCIDLRQLGIVVNSRADGAANCHGRCSVG